MTDQEIFRTCYNLLVQIRQAGDKPGTWRQVNQKTAELVNQYDDCPLLLDMLRAVYNEGCRDYAEKRENISVKAAAS